MDVYSFNNKRIGRYTIQRRIGRGGMAQVFQAWDATIERPVAIKILHDYLNDDASFKERFEREAKLVGSFNHPNIVRVYDFDTFESGDNQLCYMVMPYIPGDTLREEFERAQQVGKRIALDRVLEIVSDIANALDYAHQRGMVHRDVKPANILFDENRRAILTDFGIARMVSGSSLTQEGVTVGTPTYMSPEQATGEAVDGRSDIYALGIIVYELLLGKPPFEDKGSVSILLKHLQEPIPSLSLEDTTFHPAVDRVLNRALAKQPKDRYATATDFIQQLREVLHLSAHEPDTTQLPSAPSSPSSSARIPAKPDTMRAAAVAQPSDTQLPRMTQQVQTIARSPAGILVFGLAVLGLLLAVAIARNLLTPSGLDVVSGEETISDDAASMTGIQENYYFENDFSGSDPNRQLWLVGENGLISRSFNDDGQYVFTNRRVGRAVTSVIDPQYQYGDVTISLHGLLDESSANSSGYGIVFRYQDEDNYNVFAVDGLGRYSIWVRKDGVWRELRSASDLWTREDVIESVGQENQMTIDIFNNRFVGYINGRLMFSVEDDTFARGAIGLYLAVPQQIDGQATLIAKRYSVSDVAESMTASMTGSEDGSPGRDLR